MQQFGFRRQRYILSRSLLPVCWLLFVYFDAGIRNGQPLGEEEDRIQVQLLDFRVAIQQLGEISQECGQGLQVQGPASAETVQERVSLDLPEHLRCLGGVNRGDTEGDILEQLDEDAAQPEHYRRAELDVAQAAHDQFGPVLELRQQQHPFDDSLGAEGANGGLHRPVGLTDSLCVEERDAHPARLALVDDLRPLAEGLRLTLSQLAIAWILRRSEVTAAIAGFRDPEQIAEIAAAADCALDEETIRKIQGLTDRIPALFNNP